MKNIISASRRTDIPAFYSEWFIQRLKEEEVFVKNPYGGQIYRVALHPDNMHCIVFWSKNYAPLITRIQDIEKITRKLFFHFTITGMTEEIEQNTPSYKESIKDYIYLARRYSPDHLIWRFDPICITDKLPFEFFEQAFSRCAEQLEGSCSQCYISFVQKYKKVLVNFDKYTCHEIADIPINTQQEYADRLAAIAARHGIKVYACCNDHLLSESIHKGSCINSKDLARIIDDHHISAPINPTREKCACSKSIDIGAYDTCPHGCLYCYANTDKLKALKVHEGIHKNMNGLGFHVEHKRADEKLQAMLFI